MPPTTRTARTQLKETDPQGDCSLERGAAERMNHTLTIDGDRPIKIVQLGTGRHKDFAPECKNFYTIRHNSAAEGSGSFRVGGDNLLSNFGSDIVQISVLGRASFGPRSCEFRSEVVRVSCLDRANFGPRSCEFRV